MKPFLFLAFLWMLTLQACTPPSALPSPSAAPLLISPMASTRAPAQPAPPSPLPPTASPLPLLASPPTPTPNAQASSPTESPGLQAPVFPLALPVPISGTIPIDPSYRFASTQSGLREPHHGLEFLLPFGSPVLAAADGTVLFAGDDNNGSPYSPLKNYAFYGNFIILEHSITQSLNHPITHFYSLYAHLSQSHLQTGDTVRAGDEIGLIGFSGAALGPHLHFEVRLNGLTYADSYNPELFLLQPDHGVLVGHILDANGFPIPPTALTLTPLNPGGRRIYLTTYEDNALALRPPYHENFALALPPGQYELTFILYGIHTQTLTIQSGEITFFDITVGDE